MNSLAEPSPALTELDTEQLEQDLLTLAGNINAAEYRLVKLLDAFDAAGGWKGDGIRSYAHWLNWKLGMGSPVAREKVRVARALRDLPLIDLAFHNGEVSYSKVRAMTRVATPANEEYLLMIAQHGTTQHIENLVRCYRRIKPAPDYETPDYTPPYQLSYYFDEDGSFVIRGRLAPDDGARLLKALEVAREQIWQEQQAAENVESVENVMSAEDQTGEATSLNEKREQNVSAETFLNGKTAISRIDTLLQVAEQYLDGTTNDGNKSSGSTTDHPASLILHVNANPESMDYKLNRGDASYTPDYQFIAPEIARQLACDAAVSVAGEDDVGRIVSIGRQSRVVPRKMRMALQHRDRCCRFPGCSQHRWVDAHHIHHWADGGETSLDNLILLCRHHHRALHQEEYSIEQHDDGLTFRNRYGCQIPGQEPLPQSDQSLPQINQSHGLSITHKTAACRWVGEVMDYDIAVGGLMARDEIPGSRFASLGMTSNLLRAPE